jgi:DNA-binding HxlR family transcriptional regulator
MPEQDQRRKSYGQFCGLARGLDHIGDRWTLLIVRELLLGPSTYRDLRAALEGIATNLLTSRLRQLETDGIVRRSEAPRRSKAVTYELTELGLGLEPALLALIRWGSVWMFAGPGTDTVDARWGSLALRALLDDTSFRSPRGAVLVDLGREQVTVLIGPEGRTVHRGPPAATPRAVVKAQLPSVLGFATGLLDANTGFLNIEGDRELAERALRQADEWPRARTGRPVQ